MIAGERVKSRFHCFGMLAAREIYFPYTEISPSSFRFVRKEIVMVI